MMESAMVAGFTSVGMDVVLLGPMPTPAVAMLTRSMRADLGVMISASHNPFADNGIKLFGPDGFKLSDADEEAIEQAMAGEIELACDGDADRLIVIDEKGQTVDGDQIMALIATHMAGLGELKGGGVVATVMSNLGLERFLGDFGLNLVRTKVGDRNVLEAMREGGYNVGGEQSGHMILLDHATTGDGCIAALQVLAALVRSGKKASELLHLFDPVPQLLKNVVFDGGDPLGAAPVKAAIADGEAALGKNGRLVIRKSGTEPKIRVLAEGDDAALVERVVDAICAAVKAAA
jgi:phosphoglucosamine mutase